MVDHHFWPSMYPGIIVGLVYGAAIGGLRAIVLGAVGGLVGTAASYFALRALGVPSGIATLAGMIVASLACAAVVVAIGRRIAGGADKAPT